MVIWPIAMPCYRVHTVKHMFVIFLFLWMGGEIRWFIKAKWIIVHKVFVRVYKNKTDLYFLFSFHIVSSYLFFFVVYVCIWNRHNRFDTAFGGKPTKNETKVKIQTKHSTANAFFQCEQKIEQIRRKKK